MLTFKCKMCGGDLEFEQGASVAECPYCGTRQTLPKLNSGNCANLYDRANHFRRNNDYDKAMSLYEKILEEDKTDAEAYWSIVLCRYGIEYVEDPTTKKRVPTINRTQYASILADEDYKSAISYADSVQRGLYESEAKYIDSVQRGILAISQKEEPFDVFLCYKETDDNGRRTRDSVLTNDIYHQLMQEGMKVFFAKITLEDKIGEAYEPYIFAALNSAKVMVVLGTKPEYFNAVWVKNEWSRYLSLIRAGQKKTLIPAYKDMDPYDLPEDFSHLQALDMGKIGFMPDLIRGIKKLVEADATKKEVVRQTVVMNNAPVAGNTSALLKRAFMFLEDGEWEKADEFCEQVLNQNPENAEAYLGKLMAELKVHTQAELQNQKQPFDRNNNYQKVLRFGDTKLKEKLKGTIAFINNRNELAQKNSIYDSAVNDLKNARSEYDYERAAEKFNSILGFKDSEDLSKKCSKKLQDCKKDSVYYGAIARMKAETLGSFETAIKEFSTIPGWRDVDEQTEIAKNGIARINEERIRQEKEKMEREIRETRNIKITIIVFSIIFALIVLACVYMFVIKPANEYRAAVALKDSGRYEEAVKAFKEMNGYKDSNDQIIDCEMEINDIIYNNAINMMNDGKIIEAYESLIALNGYKDSVEKANGIFAQYEAEKMRAANVGDNVYFGSYEQDNNTSNGKEDVEWVVLAKEGGKTLVISKYALDCQEYNTTHENVTWETCSLRSWLNQTFLKDTFSAEEQTKIAITTVSADKNPDYSTDPGNATNDKVFLLSVAEAEKYFNTDNARKCIYTSYCYAQGTLDISGDNCWWWLRSPGQYQEYAEDVTIAGTIGNGGRGVDVNNGAVRPAMWINLES